MKLFDRGSGPPLVVVQGLHGRWEWTTPALRALSRSCRTISYSLCGDIGSRHHLDPSLGFDNYVRQLDRVFDQAGVARAALCGISFGGFVAVRYAALRPERVAALVLASAPGPGWTPNPQQSRWISRPWLSLPGFVLSAPFRIWPEVSSALPQYRARATFLAGQAMRCVCFPMMPGLMAQRIRSVMPLDFTDDAKRVRAATLIVTGQDNLDRVVPVGSTCRYESLIANARHLPLAGTGHMGVLTQPARFADVVGGFVYANSE